MENMRIKRIGKVTAALGMSAILMSGCSLFGPEQETSTTGIDVPPVTETAAQPFGPDGPVVEGKDEEQSKAPATEEQTVYLEDANGYIVPVSLALPASEGPAKQVLTYMVKGGPVEDLLPTGFHAVLPQGTEIKGINIKNGTATVDFSPQFKKYEAKDENNILDAIVGALTQFPTVKNVSIWVNGTPLREMPVDKTPIPAVLDHGHGINLELTENAVPGRTSAVTVYFQGQIDDKRTYYVPVTRLIPQTDNIAKAAIEELIKGPKEGSLLFSSFLGTTKVLDVQQKDDTVTVNLSGEVLKYDSGKEAHPEAMESLVLSLTENTGAKKVQVLVEGQPLAAAGANDYSKPVTRPARVNAIQF
jgi:germination protein M